MLRRIQAVFLSNIWGYPKKSSDGLPAPFVIVDHLARGIEQFSYD